jgi:hypothetical protein
MRIVWKRTALLLVVSVVLLLAGTGSGVALQVGDKAPSFALPATTAEKIDLAEYVGKKPVVLFFFIGAFTKP